VNRDADDLDPEPVTVVDPWAHLPMDLTVEMDEAERAAAQLLVEEIPAPR
jgi:hypothetical protein